MHELDTRLGFLGQFSAVDQVELRAQVGGTLTGIHFKDGDIVHRGDLLFTIDSRPYEIRLAQAKAQLETATARRVLADSELQRAQELERNKAGTVQNVEQRTSDLQAAQASVDDAGAQIRDAQFDLDHCDITAPFTGRIGAHLVSVGNLIAGSRAATSPTTLLATLVSLDPIHLDFDMSEADFQAFSQYRAQSKGMPVDRVDLALGNEKEFARQGVLDFINNVLDRSSGTIHARATVPNPDLLLTPGEFARVRLVVAHPEPAEQHRFPARSAATYVEFSSLGLDTVVIPGRSSPPRRMPPRSHHDQFLRSASSVRPVPKQGNRWGNVPAPGCVCLATTAEQGAVAITARWSIARDPAP